MINNVQYYIILIMINNVEYCVLCISVCSPTFGKSQGTAVTGVAWEHPTTTLNTSLCSETNTASREPAIKSVPCALNVKSSLNRHRQRVMVSLLTPEVISVFRKPPFWARPLNKSHLSSLPSHMSLDHLSQLSPK